MSEVMSHPEEHKNQVRGLVEDSLSADEGGVVERRLLSCPACLEEYNWYSRVWASITDRDQFLRWGHGLAVKDPKRDEVFRRAVDLVRGPEAAEASRTNPRLWGSAVLWRNLCFVSAAVVVLIVSGAVYELRRSAAARDEWFRARATETSDLKARVDRLSSENASRETQLAELRQTLERHATPRPNTVLSVDFSATRRPDDVGTRSILLAPDKTFLELRINTIERKNYESYLMILRDNSGHTLWQSDGVTKNDDDMFSLTLGTGFLKPGNYEVLIYGQRHTRDLIGRARFHITYGQ
jgi:hypothetical protein